MTSNIKTSTIEVATMHDALVWFRGNQTAMANHLGVERGTIRKKLGDGKAKQTLLAVQRHNQTIIGFELINRYR